MNRPIRDGRAKIIGYHDAWFKDREILRDKPGRILGRFGYDTKVTRDAAGRIIGRGHNQLMKLLP